jgi:TPR repeat protein
MSAYGGFVMNKKHRIILHKKAIAKYVTLLITFFIPIAKGNVILGDELFINKDYSGAYEQYLISANIGSPHAYYQLGLMFKEGLGVKQNIIQSLIWLSLAAEHQQSDSDVVAKQIMQHLQPEQKEFFQQVITRFEQLFGKQVIKQRYFPELILQHLDTRVLFDGDMNLDSYLEILNDTDGATFNGFSTDNEDDASLIDGSDSALTQLNAYSNRPYILVVDHEVAKDGSPRNITKVHTLGNTFRAINYLKMQTLSVPMFKGEPVRFVNRVNMGLASLPKLAMAKNYRDQYSAMRRAVKRFKNAEDLDGLYNYARLALAIEWLGENKEAALKVLTEVATEGHHLAQFELGRYLYREKINPEEAISWISKASQYGLPQAEYELANILQHSPWVKVDERKALFWYEMAAKQQYIPAILNAVKLKLLIQR